MNLNQNLLRGIFNHGFEQPSDIQEKSITNILTGQDIIIQSQSGTGKTACFAISILQTINASENNVQAMIIAPTRELAIQINTVLLSIGKYIQNLKTILAIGGTKSNLNGGQVVIGTPGRIYDLLNNNRIDSTHIKMFVLDEADEMLSGGFINQIKEIYGLLESDQIQNIILSATMSTEIIDITENFMNNPLKILLKSDNLTLEGIRQFYINVEKEQWKLPTIYDLYDNISVKQTIIFVNTKQKLEWVYQQMRNKNYPITMIHGSLSQDERNDILQKFKNGNIRMLLSSDIFARGIDVQQVSLVINYDLPNNIENYIHRIGRSGRYGRKGISINLVTTDDLKTQSQICTYYNTNINELPSDLSNIL